MHQLKESTLNNFEGQFEFFKATIFSVSGY